MPEAVPQPETPITAPVPLCVDLDGTLVKSDTLVDSLLALLAIRPMLAFQLPGRLRHGKAAFKAFVAESISLDVAHLPYNHKLLQFLHEERARGRAIYLTTGADMALARRVAVHLGIFAGVLASDGTTNLTGSKKLKSLRASLGSGPFDYIGNDTPDLPLLAKANAAMVANPSLALTMELRSRRIRPARQFNENAHPLKSLLKAVRLKQWAKNLLVFVPLLLSHAWSADKLFSALDAFFCLSLAGSAACIVDDLLNMEADRRHPQKRLRPFASGDLPALAGLGMVAIFLLLALLGGSLLSESFLGWLLLYLAATLAYSLYLKRIALVDVLVLAGLYILRLLAGGAATLTPVSHSLAGFSIFLFLSLAIVKRFAELENLRAGGATPKSGQGYQLADMEILRGFGAASAFAAVVVFAIYIGGAGAAKLYSQPGLLWLIVPLMILWLSRMWLIASRAKLDEDPVVFALSDGVSLLIAAAIAIIALIAI
jgi:4-hydroxybenzoate polyprenyltransferase/phosphoserine phosphatase